MLFNVFLQKILHQVSRVLQKTNGYRPTNPGCVQTNIQSTDYPSQKTSDKLKVGRTDATARVDDEADVGDRAVWE